MPPRIAIHLTENLVTAIGEMMNVDVEDDVFGDSVYAVITPVSPIEFNFKLVNEDEIYLEAANDSELQIIAI